MDENEEYEILKISIIKSFANYIRVIDESTLESFNNLPGRLLLMDEYISAIKANIAFRDFWSGRKK